MSKSNSLQLRPTSPRNPLPCLNVILIFKLERDIEEASRLGLAFNKLSDELFPVLERRTERWVRSKT